MYERFRPHITILEKSRPRVIETQCRLCLRNTITPLERPKHVSMGNASFTFVTSATVVKVINARKAKVMSHHQTMPWVLCASSTFSPQGGGCLARKCLTLKVSQNIGFPRGEPEVKDPNVSSPRFGVSSCLRVSTTEVVCGKMQPLNASRHAHS